MAFLTLVKLSN